MMEEMSGVELLMQIKEMNSLMQIFVMTSHSTLPHVIQCMQGGAYDFFEKPLKIEEILISLGEAARRASRWSSLYSRHSLSPHLK
jgi:DNA-binding NtrC family response regulator